MKTFPPKKSPMEMYFFYLDSTLFYVTYLTGGEKYVQWKQRISTTNPVTFLGLHTPWRAETNKKFCKFGGNKF